MGTAGRTRTEKGAVDMTNQSPESVIAEAMVNAGAPLMHSRVEEGVASALRASNMLREPGDAALAAIERVRAEHSKNQFKAGGKAYDYCGGCYEPFEAAIWPCPTIQALGDVSNDQNLINPHNHAEVW